MTELVETSDTNGVIEINNDEIFENFDSIIKENRLFAINSNIENINAYIFYVDNKEIVNYKKYEINISQNTLKKKELTSLVLNNNHYYSKKYDLIGIYK